MEQLLDMEQLKKLTPEQQSQVLTGLKQQAALVNAQNLITALSEKCTTKCIMAPGSSLSGSEKQCIQRCMDRFIESWNVVSHSLQRRLQQEANSGGGGASLGTASTSSGLSLFGDSGNAETSGDFGMVLTNDLNLPSDKELTVPQEITLSTPWFKAVSIYMAKECEEKMKHFMLLRREYQDPRKTLKEGAEVTACGVEFLKKLKKTCNNEVSGLANCLDQASNKMYLTSCRDEQRYLDRCVEEKHGMERPKMGYFSRLHIHDPGQPKPTKYQRDYKAEASKLMDELPENYVIPKNYMKYSDYKFNWFKKWGSN